MKKVKFSWIILIVVCFQYSALSQQEKLIASSPLLIAERMAQTILNTHPDSLIYLKETKKPANWNYENGVILNAFENLWLQSGDAKYYKYIQKIMDSFISDDGSIRTYPPEEYNLDNIAQGRLCLTLYQVTGKEKYKKAADKLHDQLLTHPRTNEGGYWHKKKYPYQMWLDGLYMAEPFKTQYEVLFGKNQNLVGFENLRGLAYDDIVNQFVWMEKHARDAQTGLFYHGWDEAKKQSWANKETGLSKSFWGRADGWYGMALVEVINYLPENYGRRKELIAILQRFATAIASVQDKKSGVWFQVLDKGNEKGNFLEASASCMFVTALAKGVRLGILDKKYLAVAQSGYAGILKNFVTENSDGTINLEKTVSVGSLNDVKNGTFEYYISEPTRQNDLKGVGPFINASLEIERAKESNLGAGKTVVVDYFFNNEYKKGFDGKLERFHYTLEDRQNSGFSVWAGIFNQLGAKTKSLEVAPTFENLKSANVYIIVDPDTKKETESPNYMNAASVTEIKKWVEAGGNLVLMANDTSNCEITHFNTLAGAFGIQFSNKNRNFVKNDQFEQGQFIISNNAILKTTRKIYVKELSVLSITKPAESVLSEGGDVIIATAKIGKGHVFAIGDPWLYNEYVDGRKLPADFENFNAAKDVARWLLKN